MTGMDDRPTWSAAPTRSAGSAAPSPRPAARRRRDRVDAGVAELLIWLEDQLATGLARLQSQAFVRFESMAARLVDAQAPGLAGRVRALAEVTASGPGWNDRLLAELAQLYALATAHQQLDLLDAPLAATVRSHIGYPTAKASVLSLSPVPDAWYVIGRHDTTEGVLSTRRTWLVGGHTGRTALVLSFATRAGRLDDTLRVGTTVLADLHFYTASLPLRALIGTWHGVLGESFGESPEQAGPAPPARRPPAMSIAQARRCWSACLERDPWVGRTAMVLAVAPARGPEPSQHGAAMAPQLWRDAAGDVFPETGGTSIEPTRATGADPHAADLRWVALAIGGGEPVTLCAEVSDRGLTPMAVWGTEGSIATAPQDRS